MSTLVKTYRRKFAIGGELGSTVPITQKDWTGIPNTQYSEQPTTTPTQVGSDWANSGGFKNGYDNGYATPKEDAASYGRAGNYGQAAFNAAGSAFLSVQDKQSNSNYKPAGSTATGTAAKTAMTGASMGATVGSAFGPVGTVVGGFVGAVGGGVYGYVAGSKRAKKEKAEASTQDQIYKRVRESESQSHQIQSPGFSSGNQSVQMYKHGGRLKRPSPKRSSPYKMGAMPPAPSFNNLSTTEYKEPNEAPIPMDAYWRAVHQTVLDQSGSGKAWNTGNTSADFLKKRTLPNAAKLGAEFIKFGIPIIGDAVVNLGQESVDSYTNPSRSYGLPGNAQRKYGGPLIQNFLANQKALGGSMTPMSKDTTVASGPSHAQGGIDLPAQRAQVEGGETTAGNFVFSKELGFAQLHKPIARAQGKIEKKNSSPERINSLKLLNARTERLASLQEAFKQHLNIQ